MAMESLMRLARLLQPGRTEPRSPWRPPVVLDRGSLGQACLDLDDQGHGSAVWENAGSLWTMPIGPRSSPGIVRLPLGEGTSPQIVLNADGRGIALWQIQTGLERQILGKILGGSAESARVLFRTEGEVRHLQGAVDRRGNAMVLWLLETGGPTEVMALAFDMRDLAWEQRPTTLGIPSSPAAEPRIALNYRQNAMVVWQVEENAAEGLVASHYWPSDRIWSDRPVSVVSRATHSHQVAMDDLGNALAIWIHAPHGQRSQLEGCFYDGKHCEWGEPEVLARAQTLTLPRLAMSGDGEAFAAWGQAEGGRVSRLVTKFFGKGRWVAGLECLELEQGHIRDFAIDLGVDGRAALLATHRGAEGDWVSGRLRQKEWSPSTLLAPPSPAPCSAPRIRLCSQGASALWIQGVGTQGSLVLVESR
jgi:hypothetical protein